MAASASLAGGGSGRVVTEGFHERVAAIVRRIPPGRVATYGDVASLLGSPRVARHVGWALSAIDDPTVPWHRVVNARGAISGDADRIAHQGAYLRAEGVPVDDGGRLDLRAFRWLG